MDFADGIVISEHVEIKRSRRFAYPFQRRDIWRGPPSRHYVVILLAKVQQFGQGVVESSMKANHQLKVWVGVKVDLTVCCVLELFDEEAVASEDSKGRSGVITGNVELLSAADLHSKQVSLKVIVEGCDFGTGVVVNMCNPGWVAQVSVEVLHVLAQAALAGYSAAESVVAILNRPAAALAVDAHQEPFGVVLEDLRAPLTEEAVFIHSVLDISQASNAVSQVVAQWKEPGAVPCIQQMQITVEIIRVAPHDLFVQVHGLELAVDIVLITVLGGVCKGADFDLSLDNSPHIVILERDPVHERTEYLILDLLDPSMCIKVFGVGHNCRGYDLVYIVIDYPKLSKLLHLSRDVIILIEIDWQWCFIDHALHAGDTQAAVVGVIKASIDHAVFTEAEDLPVDQRAHLAITDGADETFILQVNGLQQACCLVVGKTDPGAVVQDLRQLVLPAVPVEDPATRAQVSYSQQEAVLAVIHSH